MTNFFTYLVLLRFRIRRYHLYVKEQKKSGVLGVSCDSVKKNSRQIWMLSFLLCANTIGYLQINVFSTSIVYLTSSSSPIIVFSDHNPLMFIHKMKNKNQR